jgi:hypothetical protein
VKVENTPRKKEKKKENPLTERAEHIQPRDAQVCMHIRKCLIVNNSHFHVSIFAG